MQFGHLIICPFVSSKTIDLISAKDSGLGHFTISEPVSVF
uniref:Uncharacterized protein n=1 Tax=Anguilla anguilla TaxID=7936 RepID=A0A0E9WDP1_ANGAN